MSSGSSSEATLTGLDRHDLLRERLERRRFGLLTNQASLDRQYRPSYEVLAELFPQGLAAIFAPQHGLGCEQQANMIKSPHGFHRRLQVPVYSLYSDALRPTPAMLKGIDTLVVDLQDVGTRVYTFIWTVSYCLEACAEQRIPLVVLDRPNPLGGVVVEGPQLEPEYASFVGRSAIPMRHGLTLGELTLLVNEQLGLGAEVHVVPLSGWRREQLYDETGLAWLPPSPNMPTTTTALVYPGQVLLEGTNLSEGRGTTTPFQVIGAPFIDPDVLLPAMADFALPGLRLVPVAFQPTFDKWQDQRCAGVMLHVTDPHQLRSYAATVSLLAAIARLWPDHFHWLDPPYEYETVKWPIDIISGSSRLREAIDSGQLRQSGDVASLVDVDQDAWHREVGNWMVY